MVKGMHLPPSIRWPTARALMLACHPAPAAAVTGLAGLLAATVGAPAWLAVAVMFAVGSGQLSIGWSNDWLDAARDRAVGRTDKPLATGLVTDVVVRTAALTAVVVTVVASVALGWRGGVAQLIGVASAWAYNAGLKGTRWSWAPYALTFGLLPAVVTLASSPGHWPAWWAMTAGALLGVGAHLVNVLPDLADDAATGVRGLPHRLGASVTGLAAPAVLWLASAAAIAGPPGAVAVAGWLALVAAGALGCLAVAATRWPAGGRGQRLMPLAATAAIAAVDVAALVQRGSLT
jgi:4-hydroxybenzoate polyprenyltransferase